MGSPQSLPQWPKLPRFILQLIPLWGQPYHSLFCKCHYNVGKSLFSREVRLQPPKPSSWSRWEWRCLKSRIKESAQWKGYLRLFLWPTLISPIPLAWAALYRAVCTSSLTALYIIYYISYIIYGLPCIMYRSPGCLVHEGEGRFLMQNSRPEQSLTLPRRKDLTPSLSN